MTEEVRFSGDLAFDVFSPHGTSYRFSQGFHEVTNRRPDALAEPVAIQSSRFSGSESPLV